MPPAKLLLKLANVSKRYDSPDSARPITVLEDINLELESGASLAVVGPSGSGKSTLLHIMGTLDRATSGEVLLNGENLGSLDEVRLAGVRNRRIGFVFQAHYLLPHCTVLENVLVPTLADGQRKRAGAVAGAPGGGKASEPPEARARRLLDRVGLGARRQHRPGQLSGGERQRVAVVRALINQPQLLLADEPTGSLDHASAQELGQLLVDLNREEGVTLVVVTHARELARRMGGAMELRDGRLSSLPS
jgi:ABC-type lipoprotein export system ATPase subunit